MLIHVSVVSSRPKSLVRRDEIIAMHALSGTKQHSLTDDPETADLILLAGDLESLAQAQQNSICRNHPEKTLTYSETDVVIPYLPGVYCSASRQGLLGLRRTQSNIYFSRYGSAKNPQVRYRPSERKQLLFSFRGRRDCRVRANILSCDYARPDVDVMETTGFMHWQTGVVGKSEAQMAYADSLARSHFALCPRGMGLGSIRLFEAMEMGVAPVLLADRYALPPGPDWESFLLKVPEREFCRLPELLEPHLAESAGRGEKARAAWQAYFAPEVVFDKLIDQLCRIRSARRVPEQVFRRFWPILQIKAAVRCELSGIRGRSLELFGKLRGGAPQMNPRA